MRTAGAFIALLGLGVVIIGMMMDTTVPVPTSYATPSADDLAVHNIGLLQRQLLMVIIGGVLCLSGSILFGVGALGTRRGKSLQVTVRSPAVRHQPSRSDALYTAGIALFTIAVIIIVLLVSPPSGLQALL